MNSLSRLALLGLILTLAGCGGTAEALGLGRNPPDEFSVVERPPLAMPPEFTLRPPQPGAARPQETSMPERAQTALFGEKKINVGKGSSAEQALLAATGADKADDSIRETIDREAREKVVGDRHLVEELLWWRNPRNAAPIVDSSAEAARLKEAKEKGESVTSGATPIIEKDKGGWLGL